MGLENFLKRKIEKTSEPKDNRPFTQRLTEKAKITAATVRKDAPKKIASAARKFDEKASNPRVERFARRWTEQMTGSPNFGFDMPQFTQAPHKASLGSELPPIFNQGGFGYQMGIAQPFSRHKSRKQKRKHRSITINY
jgi:hypothetical protein